MKAAVHKRIGLQQALVFELELISPIRRGLVNMLGKAYVNGVQVFEAEMLAQVIKDKVEAKDKDKAEV